MGRAAVLGQEVDSLFGRRDGSNDLAGRGHQGVGTGALHEVPSCGSFSVFSSCGDSSIVVRSADAIRRVPLHDDTYLSVYCTSRLPVSRSMA